MKTESRIAWIDVVKGILLVFICFSHFGEKPYLMRIIVAPTAMYWVPIFIIVSGYLFKVHNDISFVEYAKRKTLTLLVPYLFFSALFILLDWNTYIEPPTIIHNLGRVIITGIGPYKASPLWFVTMLYFTSLAAYWLERLWKRPWVLLLVVVLLSLLSWGLSEWDIKLPLLIHLLPGALVYFIGGTLIRVIVDSPSVVASKRVCLTLLTIGGGILGLFINLGDFHLCIVRSYPLCFLCPLSVALAISLLLKWWNNPHTDIFSRFMMWIARNGFTVLAAHVWLVIIIKKILPMAEFGESSWIVFIVKTIFVFAMLYILLVPAMNTFAYKLMGKTKTNWKENYKL